MEYMADVRNFSHTGKLNSMSCIMCMHVMRLRVGEFLISRKKRQRDYFRVIVAIAGQSLVLNLGKLVYNITCFYIMA